MHILKLLCCILIDSMCTFPVALGKVFKDVNMWRAEQTYC